jgi:hypothetical protein|tara:strand:- start:135 stop:605 length:471 start_codon:yes stop_codon:yes gene_type:complete
MFLAAGLGDYKGAIKDFTKAIALKPHCAKIHIFTGNLKAWTKQNYCFAYKKACDLGNCSEYNKSCKTIFFINENYLKESRKLNNNSDSIIIGIFGAKSNANNQKQTLIKEGFDNIDISKVGNVYRVSVLVSGSKERLQQVHKRVKVYHNPAWISYN